MTDLNKALLESGIGDASLRQKIVALVASEATKPVRTAIRSMAAAARSNPENMQMIKYLKASAQRLGFQIVDDEIIDTFKLDAALKGKDISRRLELKIGLSQLGLIP